MRVSRSLRYDETVKFLQDSLWEKIAMPTDFLISFIQNYNCVNLFILAGLIKSHMFSRPCLSSLVLPMLHIRFYKVFAQLGQPQLIDVLILFPKNVELARASPLFSRNKCFQVVEIEVIFTRSIILILVM